MVLEHIYQLVPHIIRMLKVYQPNPHTFDIYLPLSFSDNRTLVSWIQSSMAVFHLSTTVGLVLLNLSELQETEEIKLNAN